MHLLFFFRENVNLTVNNQQELTIMNSKPLGQPGATFLTGKQAAEILEKLKVIKNIDGQSIKIQTIQTNPQTGVKKLVAIPIQSAPSTTVGGGTNLSVSPMKTLKTSESPVLTQGRTIKIGSPSNFSNVSLVRALPTSLTGSGAVPVSIQQPNQTAVGVVTSAGVLKLPSHTIIQASSASSLPVISTQATVMSKQRVTLTPQKPTFSLTNVVTSLSKNNR